MDLDRCDSQGLCVSQCPEVFELDAEGRLVVLEEHPDEHLRPRLELAARFCPTRAITIVG